MALKTIRIIAANDRPNRCPTWNIATTRVPDINLQWPQYIQAGGAALAHEFPEVVAGATGSGPFTNGLKTVYVPGYTGPL